MTRHKHYSEIIAWAEGAEIEGRADSDKEWVSDINPGWFIDCQYRIKPRTVKREGWVNIYKDHNSGAAWGGRVHATEDRAKEMAIAGTSEYRVGTVKIEWEETE